MKKRLLCLVIAMTMLLLVTPTFADGEIPLPTSGSSYASWHGYGSYKTSQSLVKLDSGTGYRYKWNSPIKIKVTTLTGGSVTIQPVNANDVSMGSPITYTSSFSTFQNMPLSNVNYMHIHLKITASSNVYSAGSWKGSYYIQYS